ncbi:MAG: hypothetical protein WAU00_20800 [Caldilinea sp.]|uniref:hypothetical protein n=1 Tax=Caldilinea sp. TaxID=2293560 RepID=UPI002CDFBA6F|nr:hypothetical protein [Anaerolineales bacterium]HQY90473.1 hypothetical protein [Caldilinea sp.]HRA67499.1 hypothetical protein [Caldilinea sp.]
MLIVSCVSKICDGVHGSASRVTLAGYFAVHAARAIKKLLFCKKSSVESVPIISQAFIVPYPSTDPSHTIPLGKFAVSKTARSEITSGADNGGRGVIE